MSRDSSPIPTHFVFVPNMTFVYVVMTPSGRIPFLLDFQALQSWVDSAIGAPNAVVKCATLGSAGRHLSREANDRRKKDSPSIRGWKVRDVVMVIVMMYGMFVSFFPPWSRSHFLRWNVGPLWLLVWKELTDRSYNNLVSLFSTGRAALWEKWFTWSPFMTQKVQVTSSYHDEILKGHLVVLLCHGCDMFLIVFFCFGGSAQESWPWCGIPCGLGHCEGLSGGNQQLPCKAAKFASIGQLAQLRCFSKNLWQACCRSGEDGSENSISFKTFFCWRVGFWDVVGSNTKNHRTILKNGPRRLPERGISHGRGGSEIRFDGLLKDGAVGWSRRKPCGWSGPGHVDAGGQWRILCSRIV